MALVPHQVQLPAADVGGPRAEALGHAIGAVDGQFAGLSSLLGDLDDQLDPALPTPRSVLLSRTAADHWAEVRAMVAAAASAEVAVNVAYSIKTNPSPDLLRMAWTSGMLVEAISQLELGKALDCGFPAGSVVLNGPGKWWPARVASAPLRAVFCDSLVELGQVTRWLRLGERLARVVGVRLRPPGLPSRFGVDVGQDGAVEQVAAAVSQVPADVAFGVHFHLFSELSSPELRWSVVDTMLRTAVELERACGRPVHTWTSAVGGLPARS